MMADLTLFLPDDAASRRLGEDLALALQPGDCLALSGDLGAGKSTIARALIRAIAGDDGLEVPSPTFTLVQSYPLRIPVFHFDLYRLADGSELDELGLEEAISDGICLIEWPDLALSSIPADRLIHLRLDQPDTGRTAVLDGSPAILSRIRRSLDIRAFLDGAGLADARRHALGGDASSRAYEEIESDGQPPLLLMDAPRRPPGPILQDGKYYQQLAHIAEDVRPFAALANHLRAVRLAAPAIHAAAIDQGLLLLEDLGREGILDGEGRPIPERYRASIAALAHLHGQALPGPLPVPDGSVHVIPPFDRTAIKIETKLLVDWYLPWKRDGQAANAAELQGYDALWDDLVDGLATSETSILLRDYHSPNILWRATEAGLAKVGIIDFQDAMIGPTAYDVASLVQDARVTIPPDLSAELVDHYVTLRREAGNFDETAFRRDFHVMAAQRNCKLLGIWVRLMRRDGKPTYMRHMPRTHAYLDAALAHETLQPLRNWLVQAGVAVGESAD